MGPDAGENMQCASMTGASRPVDERDDNIQDSEGTAVCGLELLQVEWPKKKTHFGVLLCFIDPRVKKIRNEASSCPGIFSRTLLFYYVASSPSSPLPHLLDGHRKLVGSSEFQQGHAQGQFGIIGEVS